MQDRARLGGLFAVVLIAHLWLLQSVDGDIYLANAVTTHAFSTRRVESAAISSLEPTKPNAQAVSPPASVRPNRKPSKPRTAETAPAIQASSQTDTPSPLVSAEAGPDTEVPLTASPAQAPAAGEASPAAINPALNLRVPGSLRLKYAATGEARKLRYSADAELHWLHDGTSYAARLEVGAFLLGKRIQTSAGALSESGLEPKRFSDKARTEVAAHFERAKGVVVFSANTPDAPLLPGAQDRLSVLLQLSALLAGAPERYPAGTRFAIQTVGPREAESWQFVVEGDETLSLKDSATPTRKLQRLPVREFDVRVEVWLAPTLDWLPVQIKLTQANGDFVQLALESTEKP